MALNDQILIDAFDNIEALDLTQDPEEVRSQMKAILIQGIKDYIMSGDIIIASGSSSGTYKVS